MVAQTNIHNFAIKKFVKHFTNFCSNFDGPFRPLFTYTLQTLEQPVHFNRRQRCFRTAIVLFTQTPLRRLLLILKQ